jgi:hypothetical protein
MKTKDRIKEEIGFDKLLLTIAAAMFSSLIGWLFNYRNQNLSITMIFVFLIAAAFLALIIFFFININTKIRELDYEQS